MLSAAWFILNKGQLQSLAGAVAQYFTLPVFSCLTLVFICECPAAQNL